MSGRSVFGSLLAAAVTAAAAPALADPAPLVLYQHGRLLNADDTPATGTVQLTVSLYENETAATAKWSETYGVALSNGAYALGLGLGGDGKKTLAAADVAGERWVGVAVGGVELKPRMRLGTVPYAVNALKAADSELLGGKAPGDYALKTDLDLAKADVDQKLALAAKLSGADFTGRVTVPAPQQDGDAATKKYADTASAAAASALLGVQSVFTAAPRFAPASGNVPFSVASGANGLVTNLNAEMVGGYRASDFVLQSSLHPVAGSERLVLDFEEGTSGGTAVRDGSPLGNNGSFPANALTRTASGHNNTGALSFVAGGGFVTVPDADSLDVTNNVTVEAWIFPTALPASAAEGIIVLKEGSYGVRLNASGQVQAWFQTPVTGTDTWLGASSAVPVNQWTHVAVSYDGLQARIFLNGMLSSVVSHPRGPLSVGTKPLTIGGRTNSTSSSFVGAIDEVRVSAEAKAFRELSARMVSCMPPTWSYSASGDNVANITYPCTTTVTVDRPTLFHGTVNGHWNSGSYSAWCIISIAVDGENARQVYDSQYGAHGYSPYWTPLGYSRDVMLQPGTHTIRYGLEGSGTCSLNGSSLNGFLLPL